MTLLTRAFIAALAAALYAALWYALQHTGRYGWTMFVILPAFLGGLGAWFVRPSTAWRAAGIGALSVAAGTLSLLLLGKEGFACVAMALPLTVSLGALGGLLVYFGMATNLPARRSTAALLLLPAATFVWDTHAKPPVFEVHTAIVVNAPPEQVWKHVVSFSALPEPAQWYFHTGLAYPKRARIVGSGPGAVRYCEFSTGAFVEPVTTWDQPRLLAFRVTQNPAPLEEWSPYARIAPKHLHGYFVSEHGEFRLTPLLNGQTMLEGTTWYRHGLWPAQYWRFWSDAIIHRIHLRVLNHVKALSEQQPAGLAVLQMPRERTQAVSVRRGH